MKDYFISMFIDNELDLDEKIDFVEGVHRDKEFKDQTIELLEQEKQLKNDFSTSAPDLEIPIKPQVKRNIFKFLLPSFTGFATACLLLGGFFFWSVPVQHNAELHRFVIYQPDAEQAEIIGNFTGWSPLEMKKIGDSGYWSISVELPEGEYRYSYLLKDGRQIADPTVLTRERDDFGGENSIIRITTAI